MHNALVVVGQVKEVTIVVNFKVALLSPEQKMKIRVTIWIYVHNWDTKYLHLADNYEVDGGGGATG